jgi:hypothetical protein
MQRGNEKLVWNLKESTETEEWKKISSQLFT